MKRDIDSLRDDVFDLLIIGGGITGAGVALDGALRGLRVALIDKGDFASGTSSVSSKLVHGGLRYLEHRDFRLVHEALHERRRLVQHAPHLVRALRFLLPMYRGQRVPRWKWRLGLLLYDLLAGRSNLHRSRALSVAGLQREVPALRGEGLYAAAEYYDAQMDDARLCLAVLRTAHDAGARVANYLEVTAFEKRDGNVVGAWATDRLRDRDLLILARQTLNATGPWVDGLSRLAGETGPPLLSPTKGVHLIVRDLGLPAALLLLHPRDGRVFFVIPWMGKTLIGTTDTACTESPDNLTVTDDEVSYLLTGYSRYFQPPLGPEAILGRFAGVRPLVRASEEHPSAISREFQLFAGPSGLLSAAGGKYTTYRAMAETITDEICRRLHVRTPPATGNHPLDGCPAEPWERFVASQVGKISQRYGLDGSSALHLLHRYGARAAEVAAYVERNPALADPVVRGEPDLALEFPYQRDHEMACKPADHLMRRTRLGLFHPELLQKPLAGLP